MIRENPKQKTVSLCSNSCCKISVSDGSIKSPITNSICFLFLHQQSTYLSLLLSFPPSHTFDLIAAKSCFTSSSDLTCKSAVFATATTGSWLKMQTISKTVLISVPFITEISKQTFDMTHGSQATLFSIQNASQYPTPSVKSISNKAKRFVRLVHR